MHGTLAAEWATEAVSYGMGGWSTHSRPSSFGHCWIPNSGKSSCRRQPRNRKPPTMLETLIVVFLVLWLLGLVTSYTLGGLIHALLVLAIIVVIVRVLQGRRV